MRLGGASLLLNEMFIWPADGATFIAIPGRPISGYAPSSHARDAHVQRHGRGGD
jgi:hypothetical protein